MKQTIRKTGVALLALIMIITAVLACSCTEKSESGFCTIVIDGETPTEYTVNLDKVAQREGLISVLDYLSENEGLVYEKNDAGYGAYLTRVGEVREDPTNGVYIYMWTSVERDYDVSVMKTTMEYEGQTLTSVGVGATSMSVADGAVIYIGTIKY